MGIKSDLTKIASQVLVAESKQVAKIASTASEEVAKVAEQIRLRDGTLVCTGVGKSGYVANKVASSLRSVGIKSIYINGAEAMHGDMGFLDPEDSLLVFSNSGQTPELVAFAIRARELGCETYGILGRPGSRLENNLDHTIHATTEAEADPLGIVPTSSSTLALACGDALVVCLAVLNDYSEQSFLINHPSGDIGHRLSISVADLMIPASKVGEVREGASLADVADALTNYPHGIVIVRDSESNFTGVITDGDLRRTLRLENFSTELKSSEILTKNPLTVDSDATALRAMEIMEKHVPNAVSAAPVVNNGEIVGVITLHLLIQKGVTA